VLLKTSAPEDWKLRHQKLRHQKLHHQKLPHQKLFHQNLKINWICEIQGFKSCFTDRNSSKDNRILVELCNGHFEGVWRHMFEKGTKALTLYFIRTVQPPSSLLCFVSTLQDKKTAPKYGYACKDVPSQWEWISNWFCNTLFLLSGKTREYIRNILEIDATSPKKPQIIHA
jgi:hypothetical protein